MIPAIPDFKTINIIVASALEDIIPFAANENVAAVIAGKGIRSQTTLNDIVGIETGDTVISIRTFHFQNNFPKILAGQCFAIRELYKINPAPVIIIQLALQQYGPTIAGFGYGFMVRVKSIPERLKLTSSRLISVNNRRSL